MTGTAKVRWAAGSGPISKDAVPETAVANSRGGPSSVEWSLPALALPSTVALTLLPSVVEYDPDTK